MMSFAFWVQGIRRHFEDERGGNLAEYGIVVVLIAVVAIAGVALVGNETVSNVSGVASSL